MGNRWLDLLRNHYTAPLSVSFRQFKLGAMLFFLGGVIIYITNTQMPSSATQEAALLAGLCIGAAGFIIAMLAQVRMLISRIVRFFME